MKKVTNWFLGHPSIFFLLTVLIVIPLMYWLDVNDTNFSWHDIKVEAHGVIFDLVVFGILWSFYDALRLKQERIQKYENEIDDFRGWDEKEAMYRITGNIRRLNRNGIKKINLSSCFLNDADLKGLNLQASELEMAKLENADLRDINFRNAILYHANLIRTDLRQAILTGANLSNAKMHYANLKFSDLQGSDLRHVEFNSANLDKANLNNAIISNEFISTEQWLDKLSKINVEGIEYLKSNYSIKHKFDLKRQKRAYFLEQK